MKKVILLLAVVFSSAVMFTACKEGKNGFRIRLICENNPDHEILL